MGGSTFPQFEQLLVNADYYDNLVEEQETVRHHRMLPGESRYFSVLTWDSVDSGLLPRSRSRSHTCLTCSPNDIFYARILSRTVLHLTAERSLISCRDNIAYNHTWALPGAEAEAQPFTLRCFLESTKGGAKTDQAYMR